MKVGLLKISVVIVLGAIAITGCASPSHSQGIEAKTAAHASTTTTTSSSSSTTADKTLTTQTHETGVESSREPKASGMASLLGEQSESKTVEIAGFTAHLTRAAQKHSRRAATLAALATRLENVVSTFPASSRDDLRRTPIWFTERKTEAPLFHPASEGLPAPELSNAIEVPSMSVLFEHLDNNTSSSSSHHLATLLAAGYFMHLAAPPWKEAEEAFAIAKTNLMTAKLGSDPLSYFSALSTAYFGRWSLPPDREALRSADPRGVDLVTRTWSSSTSGASLPTPPTRFTSSEARAREDAPRGSPLAMVSRLSHH